MSLFNEYPYRNLTDLNLDYILKTMSEFAIKLNNFITLNTIKYADPIQWDITTQYEANTIVIDPHNGNAYISVTAVPTGVSITNTEYWTPIFNYENSLNTLREQIADANEEDSTTATAPRSIGDLVWLDGYLYKVTAPMIAGDSYVVNSNCVKTTIEEMLIENLANVTALIDAERTARESADVTLQNNIDAEATTRVTADEAEATARTSADAALQNSISAEATARENAIDDLYKKISETINVKPYIEAGIDVNTLIDTGVALYFPAGEYECDLLIDKPHVTICGTGTIKGSITIDLQPVGSTFTNAYAHITGINMTKGSNNNFAIRLKQARYVMIDNIRIDNTFDYGIYFNETLSSSYNRWGHDIRVSDSMLGGGYAVYINPNSDYSSIADITFSSCTFRCGSHSGFYGLNVDGFTIDCCTFFTADASGTNSYGIYANNCTWAHITNNNIFEFGSNAIWVDHIGEIIIADNCIGYCGEYEPASGIYIGAYQWGATSTGLVQMSDIHDNIIYGATYHGIELALNTGYLKIHDNMMYRIGTSERYLGSVDLGTLNHYGIQASPLQPNNGTQIYNNYSTAEYNIAIARSFCRNNRYGLTTESAELHYEDVTVSATFAVGHSSTAFTIPSVSGYVPVSFAVVSGTVAKISFLILNPIAASNTAGYLNCYNSYTGAITDTITVRVAYVPVN